MYLKPSTASSLAQENMASVFYTTVIPMLNPLIYSLRNKEVKVAIQRTLREKPFWYKCYDSFSVLKITFYESQRGAFQMLNHLGLETVPSLHDWVTALASFPLPSHLLSPPTSIWSQLMLSWMKHKLESRLPGEISITSDMQETPILWQKVKN